MPDHRRRVRAAFVQAAAIFAGVICLGGAAAAPFPTTSAASAAAAAATAPARTPQPCTPGGNPAPHDPFCRSAAAAERSARMARGMLTIAFVQMVGLIGQIVFLILTLRESNRASRAATQAAAIASRQAEIAERATDAQLRAYVLVDEGAVRHREGEETVIRLVVKNYGQTPAFKARAWVHSWVEALPLAVALPEPPEGLPMSNQVMGPGFASTFTHRHAGRIDGVGFAEIEAGRAALYVYGAITYEDAFGRIHVSRYRLFCGGKGALAAGVLSAYPEGNDAD